MDNLTHTAIGLFLARAGLKRLSPRATGILLLAANAPDCDVVSWFGGSLTYLRYHRHITHSLVALPVMALVTVALIRFAGRKPVHWPGAFAAACIGVGSHLLLDWTNIYGIRMLLPFSGSWLRLDTTNIIDLWIWAICLLGIVGPFLSRLVGSEITSGAAGARNHGRASAIVALLFILLWDSARGVMHARAVATLSSRLYEGGLPMRVMASPDAANPFLWRGVVETQGSFFVEDVNLAWPDPSEARPAVFRKPDPEPAIEVARQSEAIRAFLEFAQYPLWRVTPWTEMENSRLVELFDMRFGSPAAPGFMASAVVNGNGQIVRSSFGFGTPRPR